MNQQLTWRGEPNRPLSLSLPCDCGCDRREGHVEVGYLTGSDATGHGFTIWIETQAVFDRLAAALARIMNPSKS